MPTNPLASKKKRAPKLPPTVPAVIDDSIPEASIPPAPVEKKPAPAAPASPSLRAMALKAMEEASKGEQGTHAAQLELEQGKKLARELKNVLGLEIDPGGPLYEQDGLVFLVRRGDLMVMSKCRHCKTRDPRADKQIVNSLAHLGQIVAVHAQIHTEHMQKGVR